MRNIKRLISTLLFVLMAVLSVVAVFKFSSGVSLGDVAESLKDANKPWIAGSIVAVAMYIIAESSAIGLLLRSSGYRSRAHKCLSYSAASIYFSAITPSSSGGQPASAYLMIKDKLPAGVVSATLAINVAMYTLATEVVGIAAILIAPGLFESFSPFSRILILVGFGTYTVLTVLFIVLIKKGKVVFVTLEKLLRFLHSKKIIRRLEPKLFKLTKARAEYEEAVHVSAGKPLAMIMAFAWNLVQRVSQIAVSVCVYMALGGKAGLMPKMFSAQSLISIGYNSVPIPGAMGVADYLMIDGFSTIVSGRQAVKLELLSRGISFYLCVLICGLIVFGGFLTGTVRAHRAKSAE